MSIAYPETRPASAHVESLQSMIESRHESVDCLIVAHSDARMIARLSDATKDRTVAVLPVCQAEWEENLSSIIAYAVDAGIDEVLIAGHSHGVESLPPQILGKGHTSDDVKAGQPSFGRLLGGARRSEQQIRSSKAHFADQISHLVNCEELRDMECSDDFVLNTLFYIAESGTFLRYSISSNKFDPIV